MPWQSVALYLECQRFVFCNVFSFFFSKIIGDNRRTKMRCLWTQEEREKQAKSETFAIRISNVANMVLFAAKVYASVRSGSLAIVASTLDSLLDLLSGFILWFTAFSMQTPNPYQYPIGKKRMQPLVSPIMIILKVSFGHKLTFVIIDATGIQLMACIQTVFSKSHIVLFFLFPFLFSSDIITLISGI